MEPDDAESITRDGHVDRGFLEGCTSAIPITGFLFCEQE
jgi:hypothetical protein